jgi:hypothetical protein
MKNREVFLFDPLSRSIPNNGVAKVLEPRTPEQWQVLRYEMEFFVCDGKYRLGLDRILTTYLSHISQAEQPAVWVSGFYGSGKSHMVRVLEYLWRDLAFPDGASARGLTRITGEIKEALTELSSIGRREGGLWSAAGTLSAGLGRSVRLGLLSIIFRSAGLPEQYAPAQFVIWLQQNKYYEAVKASVEQAGKDFAKELNNLWVSPFLANSLLSVAPDFASDQLQAREFFKTRFPNRTDISDEEMLLTLQDVLNMVSSKPGKLPCTLIIFDELQQFIGEDADRALQVQTIVEACSARFGSRLLFVATGQSALQKTTQLSKLQGRFTVKVELDDQDVEKVVRQVVLQKREDRRYDLQSILERASGEINRQLAETRIGPRASDQDDLLADYPLLPVRRRFWESVLRAIDSAGTAGQLRTQLRIVHEATREVADNQLGHVVAGDFIFDQLKPDMLQSGVLLRDIDVAINEQKKLTPDGELRARLCSLIFLIGKLPTDGVAASGLRSTAGILADLLVEDLTSSSANLRQHVPELLQDMVENGLLINVDDEFRLQTRESAEWEADYRARNTRIRGDDSQVSTSRMSELRTVINETLKGMTFIQGQTKVPRRFDAPHFGLDLPEAESGAVPIWIRDEWSVSEKTVREDAQREGIQSPIVFVFIPRLNADGLKNSLAAQLAAKETLDARPRSATAESVEARSAMEARLRTEQNKTRGLILQLVNAARIYQGGGIDLNEGSFKASIQAAVNASLVRLFPDFVDADVAGWGTVVTRASQGAADALNAIGYPGEADKHKVCKKVREFVGSAGKNGNEVRKRFMAPPYGWPQDAVDGALLALLAGGFLRAAKNGQPVPVKGFIQSQIGVTSFQNEGVNVSRIQLIELRAFFQELGLPCQSGEEVEAAQRVLRRLLDLAREAGGEAPLPALPTGQIVQDLLALAGNEQLAAVHAQRQSLLELNKTWQQAGATARERLPRWHNLQALLRHAQGLDIHTALAEQAQAIARDRSLLSEPDPLPPLASQLGAALRTALNSYQAGWKALYQQEMTALAQSFEWQQLPEAQRQSILSSQRLAAQPPMQLGSESQLLESLASDSLNDWENRLAALPARIQQARAEAAQRMAPQAVHLSPPHATLHSAQEVEDYLDALRRDLLEQIEQGRPVIL